MLNVLSDLSAWQKLWNKGVDIVATGLGNALSALLAAVVALLGWKLKLWLDLKKEKASQLQKTAIDDEITHRKTAESRRRHIARLRAELAVFADETRNVRSEDAAAELSTRYTKWLEVVQLTNWGQNLLRFNKWGDTWNTQPFGRASGPISRELSQARVRELEADIRGTDIPDESDAAFPWPS